MPSLDSDFLLFPASALDTLIDTVDLQIALDHRARVEEFQRKHRIGLLTLVFTDIVGSTELKQRFGDQEGLALIHHHHAVLREVLHRFTEAEEISTAGDSFFLVFAKPSDAVKFSLQLQTHLAGETKDSPCVVSDRIGIHVGEVFIEEAGGWDKPKDLYGLQVDACARVMSLARAGQILMTRFVFDNARQVLRAREIARGEDPKAPQELKWLNHGPYLLKGVEDPLEICEVGVAGVSPLSAPPNSEKARRHCSDESEPVLGWRPAVELRVPGTEWVLEKKLGEGGFGEVWLGRHGRLKDRRVFKFCFRADRVRSLKREVTLFRVLKERVGHHPNIVGVQEVYFNEPPYYIVMDYAEAKDLRAWSEEKGGLERVSLEDKLEIVAQVADGLEAAHEAGVIHRDVKPSNILVSVGQASRLSGRGESDEMPAPHSEPPGAIVGRPGSGWTPDLRVKLTDFGIGQVVSQEALAGVTRMGFTHTMLSPGSTQTGTHLYMAPELLSGKPASVQSDIYSLGVVFYQLLVWDFTRPVTTDWAKRISNPLLREDLEKCFAGDSEDRWRNAGSLAQNLRVLRDREGRRAAEARLSTRRTLARRGLAAVGGALILLLVAVGAIYFSNARLGQPGLSPESPPTLDRRRMIRLTNSLAEPSVASRTEADDLYFRGHEHLTRWTPVETSNARDYFRKAIEKDPNHAQAHAELALTYLHGFTGGMALKEDFKIAEQEAAKAQQLNDRLSETQTAIAQLRFMQWQIREADSGFRQALDINPNYGEARHLYSHFLMAMARTSEALAQGEGYLALDPLSNSPNLHMGWACLMARQYDRTIEYENKALQVRESFALAHRFRGQAYLYRGMHDEAIQDLERAVTLSPDVLGYQAVLGHALAVCGRSPEARLILQNLTEARNQQTLDPYYLAIIHLGLGERDQALVRLEESWQNRVTDNLGIVYAKVDPIFDSVRSEPRFAALLKKMQLAE